MNDLKSKEKYSKQDNEGKKWEVQIENVSIEMTMI